jgi:hypothetical protein
MKRTLRLLVLTAASAIALAFAGSALAAYKPALWVQQGSYKLGAASSPGFLYISSPSYDATAKMTIFSPAGYTHNFTTMTPGETVGQAYAIVKANALGGALLPLTGPVVVGNPADPATQAAAQSCTGSPSSQHVLVLDTSLQGQKVQVLDFVNATGQYVTQQICLPAPAAAPFQAQVILANFSINRVFANPAAAGGYQWVGDFTPYTGATANPAGTVESRTWAGLPSTITFKRVHFKYLKFVGHVSIHGLNTNGLRATLYYGRSARPAPNYTHPSKAGVEGNAVKGATTAPLKGSYYFIARWKVKRPNFFQMRFGQYQLAGGCQGPSPSGRTIPCLSANIAPLTSPQIIVRPAKKNHHR